MRDESFSFLKKKCFSVLSDLSDLSLHLLVTDTNHNTFQLLHCNVTTQLLSRF